jgi:hypothetical protein
MESYIQYTTYTYVHYNQINSNKQKNLDYLQILHEDITNIKYTEMKLKW